MELEEGMGRKIAVSVAAVVGFIAAILGIGTRYYSDGSLGSGGGMALVASIAFFVLAMAVIGVWLSR